MPPTGPGSVPPGAGGDDDAPRRGRAARARRGGAPGRARRPRPRAVTEPAGGAAEQVADAQPERPEPAADRQDQPGDRVGREGGRVPGGGAAAAERLERAGPERGRAGADVRVAMIRRLPVAHHQPRTPHRTHRPDPATAGLDRFGQELQPNMEFDRFGQKLQLSRDLTARPQRAVDCRSDRFGQHLQSNSDPDRSVEPEVAGRRRTGRRTAGATGGRRQVRLRRPRGRSWGWRRCLSLTHLPTLRRTICCSCVRVGVALAQRRPRRPGAIRGTTGSKVVLVLGRSRGRGSRARR